MSICSFCIRCFPYSFCSNLHWNWSYEIQNDRIMSIILGFFFSFPFFFFWLVCAFSFYLSFFSMNSKLGCFKSSLKPYQPHLHFISIHVQCNFWILSGAKWKQTVHLCIEYTNVYSTVDYIVYHWNSIRKWFAFNHSSVRHSFIRSYMLHVIPSRCIFANYICNAFYNRCPADKLCVDLNSTHSNEKKNTKILSQQTMISIHCIY